MVDQVLSCSAMGNAATLWSGVETFVERTGTDELIVVSQIYDHQAHLRSYELPCRRGGLKGPAAVPPGS